MKTLLLFVCLLVGQQCFAQYLSWFLSSQSGVNNFSGSNFNNSVLAGFKTEDGQQVSFGPVIKSFVTDQKLGNIPGIRLYSQTALVSGFNLYVQCDLANGDRFRAISFNAPFRIESGAGINFMIRERVGMGVGYNFGEFNPLNNLRESTPVFKLLYLLPFDTRYF